MALLAISVQRNNSIDVSCTNRTGDHYAVCTGRPGNANVYIKGY